MKSISAHSLRDAVKKCYAQYKKTTDIPEGIFTVISIDDGISYDFRKKINKKAKRIKSLHYHNSNIINNQHGEQYGEQHGGQLDMLFNKIINTEEKLDQLINKLNNYMNIYVDL